MFRRKPCKVVGWRFPGVPLLVGGLPTCVVGPVCSSTRFLLLLILLIFEPDIYGIIKESLWSVWLKHFFDKLVFRNVWTS